ncbi:hypothetical protein OG302_02210 [Streptomyces sp. NBC_01283]|nr:hypothetical protein OG302_02210 [Streptomyces sp. NBC_01283]
MVATALSMVLIYMIMAVVFLAEVGRAEAFQAYSPGKGTPARPASATT